MCIIINENGCFPVYIFLKLKSEFVEHVVGARHPRLLPMTDALAPLAARGNSNTRFSRVLGAVIHTFRTGPRSYIHFVVMIIHTFHCMGEISSPPPFYPGTSIV